MDHNLVRRLRVGQAIGNFDSHAKELESCVEQPLRLVGNAEVLEVRWRLVHRMPAKDVSEELNG